MHYLIVPTYQHSLQPSHLLPNPPLHFHLHLVVIIHHLLLGTI